MGRPSRRTWSSQVTGRRKTKNKDEEQRRKEKEKEKETRPERESQCRREMQERQRCDYACSESLAAAYSRHSVYLQILRSGNCYAMVDGDCQLTWMEILWREKRAPPQPRSVEVHSRCEP